MSKELTSYNQLSAEDRTTVDKILFDEYEVIAKVGDYFMRNERILMIKDIELVDVTEYDRDLGKQVPTGEKEVEITAFSIDEETGKSLYRYGSYKGRELREIKPWKGTLEELREQSLALFNSLDDEEEEEEIESQGLSTLDGKQFIKTKTDLILQANQLANKMQYMQMIMQEKRWALQEITNKMMKEVKKLTRIIWTIELYMGLKENILLVQEGIPAPEEEPIHLLQERLYMDEEVGDPTNDGLDFTNIEDFDKWMLEWSDYYGHENYHLLLPFPKCVRIMRVRREGKDYSDNPWVNSAMNEGNFETYIIIRNGTTIYSIITDMKFGHKLFPGETDLMDLYKRLKSDLEGQTKSSRERNEKKNEEKMEEEIQRYKRNLIIMQGLVDRTEVFGEDLYGKINFLDGSAIEAGKVKLFYDCDKSHLIRDGQFSFNEWLKDVNSRIGDGSRVLFNLSGRRYSGYYTASERFYRMYTSWTLTRSREDYIYPKYPDTDKVVQVRIDKEYEKGQMFFTYLPDEEVYDEDNREWRKRKFKVAFALFPGADDLLNFDEITHREIQWLKDMMHNRETRKNYMKNIKFLIKVIRAKEEEMAIEDPFCKLVQSQTGCSEEEALDLLHWWKTKNKLKRALTEDDAKALRMIIKEHIRIKNQNDDRHKPTNN